ncbi:MAG: phenylalanine--tRNA ligase subunit beta, partial [Marinirhabdus sp.]
LTIPSYRNDVTREADLIEEILRVYSYNEIGFTKKLNASIAKNKPVADHRVKHRVSGLLTSLGFYEMLANSLTQSDHAPISKDFDKESQVAIINPLSQELSVMRQTMLFGMLGALSYNFNRKRNHVKLFEFGKTYRKLAHGHGENKHLSLLVSGQQTEDSWAATPKNMGYFYLKGIVTALLQAIGLGEFSETAVVSDLFAEGTTFARNKQSLVSFGAVKNTITKKFGINAEVLYADFNWDNLLAAIAPTPVAVKPVPKYPKVKRDLALLLDENIAFENLKQTALKTENKLLRDVSLFDVYTGGNLPEGKKSYALSFTLQDERKTLTDKQIDKTMKQLQQQFEKEYGATLR